MRLRASVPDAPFVYENDSWAGDLDDHRLGIHSLPYSLY